MLKIWDGMAGDVLQLIMRQIQIFQLPVELENTEIKAPYFIMRKLQNFQSWKISEIREAELSYVILRHI